VGHQRQIERCPTRVRFAPDRSRIAHRRSNRLAQNLA
jgi:hypothetical protein